MSELKPLTREDLIKPRDMKIERVDLPELGGYVYVREMTAAELAEVENDTQKIVGDKVVVDAKRVFPAVLVRTVCDSEGKRLYQPGDEAAINRTFGGTVKHLFSRASAMSSMRAGDVAEITGNSEGTGGDAS